MKSQQQNSSRSNSKEKKLVIKKGGGLHTQISNLNSSNTSVISKIPLYKQRNNNQKGLSQLLSNQSIKSDLYSKYVPQTERSMTNSQSVSNINTIINASSVKSSQSINQSKTGCIIINNPQLKITP